MEGAVPVSEISDDRKARLFVESSQARPPSSKTSFQRTLLNFTASTVFLLSSTTVLPSLATSIPPHIHTSGYHPLFGSLIEWPNACPNGFPWVFIAPPVLRHSSTV